MGLKKEEKKTLKRLPAKEVKPAPESPSVGEKKAAPPSGSKQEEITETTFLAELAEQNGLAKEKYTKNRSLRIGRGRWSRSRGAFSRRGAAPGRAKGCRRSRRSRSTPEQR